MRNPHPREEVEPLPVERQLHPAFQHLRERTGTGGQPYNSGHATWAQYIHNAMSADARAATQSTRTPTTQDRQLMRDQYGVVVFNPQQYRAPSPAQSREEGGALPVGEQLRGVQGHRESITTAGGIKRKHSGDQGGRKREHSGDHTGAFHDTKYDLLQDLLSVLEEASRTEPDPDPRKAAHDEDFRLRVKNAVRNELHKRNASRHE